MIIQYASSFILADHSLRKTLLMLYVVVWLLVKWALYSRYNFWSLYRKIWVSLHAGIRCPLVPFLLLALSPRWRSRVHRRFTCIEYLMGTLHLEYFHRFIASKCYNQSIFIPFNNQYAIASWHYLQNSALEFAIWLCAFSKPLATSSLHFHSESKSHYLELCLLRSVPDLANFPIWG